MRFSRFQVTMETTDSNRFHWDSFWKKNKNKSRDYTVPPQQASLHFWMVPTHADATDVSEQKVSVGMQRS